MLFATLFLFVVAAFNVANCFEIHRRMSQDEVKLVSLTNDISKMPEYETTLESIDNNNILFTEKTKVWTAVYNKYSKRVLYTPVEDALEKAVVHQDRSKRAALTMFTVDEQNNTYYDGTIVENSYHDEDVVSNFRLGRSKNLPLDVKPSTQKSVYPKVLLVVDYDVHRSIGSDVSKTLKYVMTFMNGVDKRFKSLEDPKVELHVAGVIIAQERAATPYLNAPRRVVNEFGVPIVESMEALYKVSKYFYKQHLIPKSKFDVVLVLTGYDLYLLNKKTKEYSFGNAGIAVTGGLCMNYDNLSLYSGISIVEDSGDYHGIFPAVHELTHLLNVEHDGGHSSTAKCSVESGFLMSTSVSGTANQFFWSPCSTRAMKDFVNSGKASCASERPIAAKTYSVDDLPGKNKTFDDHCRSFYRDKYPEASTCEFYGQKSVCTRTYCKTDANAQCKLVALAAPEGTKCDSNKHCILGECVPETNN